MALHITPAERQTLALLASGTATSEIARAMGAPEAELEAQLVGLYSRLGVSTRTEAVIEALRRGLLHHVS